MSSLTSFCVGHRVLARDDLDAGAERLPTRLPTTESAFSIAGQARRRRSRSRRSGAEVGLHVLRVVEREVPLARIGVAHLDDELVGRARRSAHARRDSAAAASAATATWTNERRFMADSWWRWRERRLCPGAAVSRIARVTHEHPHVPVRAVLLICAATLCFASLDTAIKYLSTIYPMPLLVWARWTIQALAHRRVARAAAGASFVRTTPYAAHNLVRGDRADRFVAVLRVRAARPAARRRHGAQLLDADDGRRAGASFVLGERLTPPRIAFVLAGVVGMLLIVRPGTDVFRGASLLALASAAFYATFQIMTRRMSDEDAGVLLFYPALVGMRRDDDSCSRSRRRDRRRCRGRTSRCSSVGGHGRHVRALPVHPRVPARAGARR